jgi:glycosyltransferase involved in cell wall biosynthesis
MHDLSFEVVPGEFGLRERWRRRFLARRAVRRAARVLTDTAHMAVVVGERYRVPPDRLAVVPLGVDRRLFAPDPVDSDSEILAGLNIRAPYMLWLGTVLERRMPREVLEAYSALRPRQPDLELVIAGANRMRSPGRLEDWIRELGLESRVRVLGWVEESLLGALYRGAEAGVYVSRHEGFGIPPLECLSCGTPVVVSGGLALDTAWPEYPFRCQELTTAAIERAADRALAPGSWNRELAETANGVLDSMAWETSAKLLVKDLRRVVVA